MRSIHLLALLSLLALLAATRPCAAAVPPDFVVENLVPGDAFVVPTAIAFLPDHRLLVAEKSGRLWVVANGVRQPGPMWQGETEINALGDRGLLGLAVDPQYFVNHYIYLYYTVDPDSNNIETDSDAFSRLTRYQVSWLDSNVVVPASRTILMGTSWRDGPLDGSDSHNGGALRWGADGSLLVSTGDGAQWSLADAGGRDPGMFGPTRGDPYEDIGAFRSQFIGSLSGKILRLNPANGHGYASNPFADGNLASARSRVWVYGLRNPFRFTVRPGTGVADTSQGRPGTLFLGEVGWWTWEEFDIARLAGLNFGWPCREGSAVIPEYQAVNPFHGGCDSLGSAWNPSPWTDPVAVWHHDVAALSNPPGVMGNCIIGGAFYSGQLYPPQYRGRYFFADYAQNWIRSTVVDTADQVILNEPFADALQGPVDFALEPQSGDLVYVSILTGEVRRIRYGGAGGGTGPPVVQLTVDPVMGIAPLSVSFVGGGSFDPDGGPITFAWAFGDQQGSTLANPTHVYTAPGVHTAVLTVTDTTGAVGRDSAQIIVASQTAFPSTAVLDAFNRPNGPIGASWTGKSNSLSVASQKMAPNQADAWGLWNTVFGPTQEVFVTLSTPSAAAPEHDLMLKVQGTDWASGYIEVRYDVTVGTVAVTTYTGATGWVNRGTWSITFAAGDRFGARAYADGVIEVFKNEVRFGVCSAGDWPFASAGGRVGLLFWNATASRLDDFGGGDAVLAPNTPPQVTISNPIDGGFYAAGDTVRLVRTLTDLQDPVDSLLSRWDVSLHHNNHIHPDSFYSDSATAWFVAENHDDGTGVWYEIACRVTDRGGLSDTATVFIWPEVDLAPAALGVTPPTPGSASPMRVSFRLRNLGRMPSPVSHWALTADGITLAEGDTVVAALDSVAIARVVPAALTAGTHTLRVTADSLGAAYETDEGNNAIVLPITVIEGAVGVPSAPARFALSTAHPNPAERRASFTLELPRAARVALSVLDLQGREVWHESPGVREAGVWELDWPGTGPAGARLGPGIYFARVQVDGAYYTRRVVLLR